MNRRLFLSSSTAALAAAAQTTSSSSQEKTRTAMIGVGNRGSYLVQAVLDQTNTATIGAICDIVPDRLDKAATAASKHNPKTYTDWKKVIDSKDIDAVFVATPPHLHAEMAIAALNAGKHVYCEKPVGINPEQVKAVIDAVGKNKKVTFTAGQQLRSLRQLGESVGKIQTGAIGDILQVKAQRHANADLPYDLTSADWYYDVSKSGGYLIEQSVHNLDVCNWVMNGHPWRACGFGAIKLHKNEPKGRTIYDCGSMVFEYPEHVQMTFTQNVFHPRGMPLGGQAVHVFGSKGAVDLMHANTLYTGQANAPGTLLAEKREEPPHAHITAFYECLRSGGKNPADITIGATAALTAILGHWAMSKERVIEWSEMGVRL
jgi:myo-inositol 2-dehydrogenase/D-chiro-inositol 1-dehydrogenase